MKVIKLGGSLLSDPTVLKQCLNHISTTVKDNKQSLVIVPGGGVFADLVRTTQNKWNFDDKVAHSMAILAMQQMACLLNGLQPSFVFANSITEIQKISLKGSVIIWSPCISELNAATINNNWDVTSDSLAAWLATQLDATELVLVKSANIPKKVDLQQMQEQGIVDKEFSRFSQETDYKITLINKCSFIDYSLIDALELIRDP